jgi:hypothetical protein
MSANPLDDILPSAVASHSRSVDYLGTQTIFLRAVVTAIDTARVTGLFTATVTEGATTSGNIQWVEELLRQCGYGVTHSTTNLVITW